MSRGYFSRRKRFKRCPCQGGGLSIHHPRWRRVATATRQAPRVPLLPAWRRSRYRLKPELGTAEYERQ